MHLWLSDMSTLFNGGQQPERTQLSWFVYQTDAEEAIVWVGIGIDLEASAIGGTNAHGCRSIELPWPLLVVQRHLQERAATVMEEELAQARGIVEHLATHEGQLLHAFCCGGNIGIQSHAHGVQKVAIVHLS